MKLISKVALPVVIVAIVYLLISGNLLSWSPFVIAAQLAAIAVSVWARRSLADEFSIHAEPKGGQLRSVGPYQFIRHPMYASALLLIWASILGHASPVTLAVGAIVTVIVAVRILAEEQLLRNQYPDYAAYAHRTKRIIPFVV
jgi:protein-S-isoprenylcysteine O-methyltransferase Ste14